MKYNVALIGGHQATVELKDKEAVRRLFQNHGFWDGETFYAAAAIYSITPDHADAPVAEDTPGEDEIAGE